LCIICAAVAEINRESSGKLKKIEKDELLKTETESSSLPEIGSSSALFEKLKHANEM